MQSGFKKTRNIFNNLFVRNKMKIKQKIITHFKFFLAIILIGAFSSAFYNAALAANPSITFTPNSSTIAPGTSIGITGIGFPAGSTLIIYVNNNKVSSLSPDGAGGISTTLNTSNSNINASGSNTISFAANDASGNSIAVNGNPLVFTIGSSGNGNNGNNNGNSNTATTDCTKTPNSPNCLYNPLPTGDFITFILQLMKWVLGIIGIFSVLFIMIGGFKMIMAQGNEEAYGVAKKTITWAIIGLVVAVLSFSMVAIVSNLLQANINNVNTTQSGNP